jgi:hypothetical protein
MQGELAPSHTSIYRQLIEQLEVHRALCGMLDAISQRQGQIVAQGEAGAILAVLAERESVIEELSRSNARIEPLRRVWDSVVSSVEASQRDDVAERIEALAGLIGAVSERDNLDRQALEQRRDAVVAELRAMETQRKAVGTYGRQEPMAAGGNITEATA